MANVFHILPKEDWDKAKKLGVYKPESLKLEGFIHCSKADQLQIVANSFFKGRKNLLILRIVEAKLKAKLVYEVPKEAPHSEKKFPHIYGELNLDSVDKVIDFPANANGKFDLPSELLK